MWQGQQCPTGHGRSELILWRNEYLQLMGTSGPSKFAALHAWGMTELSPIGTVAGLKATDLSKSKVEQDHILQKQGKSLLLL